MAASSSSSVQAGPSPETRQLQFEQGVAISLHLWLSLTVAVQNNLGGPASADKRDWFAGAVVEMFPSFVDLAQASQPPQPQPPSSSTARQPPLPPPSSAQKKGPPRDPEAEDVEATLLQVMWDEFETNVDDESEVEVADRILRVRAQCAAGRFDLVEDLRRRWLATRGKSVAVQVTDGGDQETDWESADDDDDDDDDGEDIEMSEAPPLVAVPRERTPPEVDGDGFTKVTRKKR
ncbi:pre-rRNA-processing protein TSR2 [Durotheca rogersii]|uniref:pre-rRNA-processing protein TSR2 n=1 Tax=Durotheca rogersii TaxID=419775 RepID=UPI0022202B7B|nr:pre-rRNA-processing protein TSR2 [Durotheca rogersii]KAI5866099.1 pre-rRNA-processing protein TSR2 [Durotheca rogersii]